MYHVLSRWHGGEAVSVIEMIKDVENHYNPGTMLTHT